MADRFEVLYNLDSKRARSAIR